LASSNRNTVASALGMVNSRGAEQRILFSL